MLFSIQDIINYSVNIEQQCGQTIPARFYDEQWEENESYLSVQAEALTKNQTQQNLQYYAQAIHLAATFLKDNPADKSKLEILSQHIEALHQQALSLLPRAVLQLPQEIDKQTLSEKKRQLEEISINFKQKLNQLAHITSDEYPATAATTAFLTSPEFLALKNYKIVLENDKSNHRFFGVNFKVKKKSQGLALLIETFEKQKTLDGINNVMKTFYNTKNESKSLYDFLNTAQGFFTWIAQDFFFWLFEAKTTTVGLIDSLDGYLQTLNKNDIEVELASVVTSNPT